jgi:poly(A) polymerase
MLPTPDWAQTPEGLALLAALDAPAGDTRLVGGAVRDALIGVAGADIDLATRLTPQQTIERVRAAGLKAIPTGLAHGTITAVGKSITAEVTTLRRDVATDGRHAEVAFTDDWRADASRRDFTINALYAALPGGQISDFFGGLEDIKARRVRFIGTPLQRIAEDHLRILRFFRFSARFADVVDADGLAACTARANDLMALSRERIALELRGILALPDPLAIMTLMIEQGIWLPVIPEFGPERLSVLVRTIAAEAASGVLADWRRRLAALLPAPVTDAVTGRLRLSNADRARVAAAAVPQLDHELLAQAWAIGAEAVVDRLLIAGVTGLEVAQHAAWVRPRLPASGRDLIARGVLPGPEVARRLGAFERAWVAAGFPQDATRIAALLDAAAF